MIDAMGCQKKTTSTIVDGADYLIAVVAGHPMRTT